MRTKNRERKASILAIIALAMLFAACSGQPASTESALEPTIFGTWEFVTDMEGYEEYLKQAHPEDEIACQTDYVAYDTYEFTDENTMNIRYVEGFEESLPYHFDGDMITVSDRVLYLERLTADTMILVERFDSDNDTLIFKRIR